MNLSLASRLAPLFVLALGSVACAVTPGDDSSADTAEEQEVTGTSESALTATSPERAVAAKLGLPTRFSIGLGNDSNGNDPAKASAFNLGTTKPDIHYMYLSGLPGEGGWTDWNAPSGQYMVMQVNAAKAKGIVPMFTLYQAAAWGEGNLGAFNNTDFMTKYWRGVRTMFTRLNETGVPAITHIEPDLWGYFQKQGDNPAAVTIKVGALVPECTDLPSNAAGFGKCIVRLARRLAPKVVVGLSASTFGAYTNGLPDPVRVGNYIKSVGGAEADITVVETLDRDAGCFEVGVDANCKGRTGSIYWTSTDFANHLAWAKSIRDTAGKPLLWWQMPLGVPSSTPGSAGRYRDNRVQYLFANAWRFASAGGIGAVFGTGAANQTTVNTDGGQFKNALTSYIGRGGNGLN